MKLKIGIIFGGRSKEREISFAGGRTVYDNLNKSLFEAVPIFIDSFNQMILLDWQYVYKGSIRDFYPDPAGVPFSNGDFQVYAESLSEFDSRAEASKIGQIIEPSTLKNLIDVVSRDILKQSEKEELGKITKLTEKLQFIGDKLRIIFY